MPNALLAAGLLLLACLAKAAPSAGVGQFGLDVELGPEQAVAQGAGWPYLFQAENGTTAVLGHMRWLPGQRDPIVFLTRSFDGRRSWEPWIASAVHGSGPVTEGVVVELPDGRIYVYDVYAYHAGGESFTGRRWLSRDGLRSLEAAEEIAVRVPGIATSGQIDDRGEAVNRLYIRRSMLRLPSGDLLACAYGRFRWDTAKVEYLPTMNQSSSYLLRSADEGRTWQLLSIIATSPLGQEGAGEPVLVRVSHGPNAGRLICQMRVGREHAVWQAESDDEGRTWTAAHPLRWTYSRFGRSRELVGVDPDLTEMTDGTLVMSYGHKIDYQDDGNFLAFSLDHGATWTAETRLSSTMTVAYTGVREVAPGELFVVYTTTDVRGPSQYRRAVDEGRFITLGRSVKVRRGGEAAKPPGISSPAPRSP
jgi:hypothetical protein